MIYILSVLIVFFRALEDGLRERKKKNFSKLVEIFYGIFYISLGAFYLYPLSSFISWQSAWGNLKYLFVIGVLIIFINMAIFDPIMHAISGWKINTVGTTSRGWDELMSRFKNWQFWVFRGAMLGLSIFWYIMAVKKY